MQMHKQSLHSYNPAYARIPNYVHVDFILETLATQQTE